MCLSVVKHFVETKSEDEADSQNFQESILSTCSEYGDTLEESMEQLKKGLENGTVLTQFEVGNITFTVAMVLPGGCDARVTSKHMDLGHFLISIQPHLNRLSTSPVILTLLHLGSRLNYQACIKHHLLRKICF